MEKQKQEIENIKIAVIDSGIVPRFSAFLPNKKSEEIDWKNINLRDTKIKKITPSRKNGHKGHYYKNSKTLKKMGHGTKCASVAAATKTEIKLYDTFPVPIEGAAPSAELYIYEVSWSNEKTENNEVSRKVVFDNQDIINAFEAAIKDEVDVISIALGADSPDVSGSHLLNPIAYGSFLAMKSNILTVAACGNSGPSYGTVENVAPWILTVGASESKKKFQATVEIGGKEFVGSSLNPFDIELPLCIFPPELKSSINLGGGKKSQDTHKREREASSVDKEEIESYLKGYIALCSDLEEMKLAKKAGAEGILYQDCSKTPFAIDYKKLPSVWLTKDDVEEIHQLICENPNPSTPIKAKICRSRMVDNPNPFTVAEFSSRGPNPFINEIFKPDMCAPGVEICVPNVNSIKSDEYTIASGTSYACPHIAGKAALIKRDREKNSLIASPASIKSALMTTTHNPNKNDNIFAEGAGFLNFDEAMNPGLVYNCGAADYFNCFLGKDWVDEECRKMDKWNKIEPWKLNYPSITVKVPKDGSKYSWHIPRRLTYVGTTSDTYKARITDQSHTVGIEIKIAPSTLHFEHPNCEKEFMVILNINKEDWTKTRKFCTASLEWSPQTNKHQCVISPIAIIGEESPMLKEEK